MNLEFKSSEHAAFYRDCLQLCKRPDVYHKALFYTLGLEYDTRVGIKQLYDFQKQVICPDAIWGAWITSSTRRICLMGFNLFNGYTFDEKPWWNTPEDLFCTNNARFFFYAIVLRYPEYFSGWQRAKKEAMNNE